MAITIETIAKFCKKKGFVYPSSEIYGGISGFFDFGPLGVELKNNLKGEWWKFHVQQRQDMVGIDGSIITHPKVWKASGHVDHFSDVMVECKKCGVKTRADHLIEDKLKIAADGMKIEEIKDTIIKNKLVCPKCGGELGEPAVFNLMFKTFVGSKADEKSIAYLRPETAQQMFTNFRLVQETSRLKLPFGIAQAGKCFRNEISPRDFLFRQREFEIMEFEYFINPKNTNKCPFIDEVMDFEMNVYSAEMQKNKKTPVKMQVKDALDKKIIQTQWHAYWLATEIKWFTDLGISPDNIRIRQHLADEKSHYALDTWDLDYHFPFGWKELEGMANRTDFDLKQHMEHSKKDLSLFIEEEKKKIIPYVVAEPSLGVDRCFLVFICDAYNDDKKRGNIVLKLHPKVAPIKVAVFPLMPKDELPVKAKEVYNELKMHFPAFYDRSGSIGRRYARQDEVGTPYCVTIDYDTLKDDTVTIRDRDTTKQKRIKIDKLKTTLYNLIHCDMKFDDV